MKTYTPATNKGRTIAINDINHKTADQTKADAIAAAKAMRHAARQEGKREAKQAC